MFNYVALGIFLFIMRDNIGMAFVSWLLFIAFVKPDDWNF